MTSPDRCEFASGDQTKLVKTPAGPVDVVTPADTNSPTDSPTSPTVTDSPSAPISSTVTDSPSAPISSTVTDSPADANSPMAQVLEAKGIDTTTPAKAGGLSKVEIIQADSKFNWLLSPLTLKIFVIVLVLAASCCAMTFVSKRFEQEALLHKYLDRAQLQDVHNRDFPSSSFRNPYWKKALGVALSLGEDNRTLADLYVKSANNEDFVGPKRTERHSDFVQALKLYESVPNSRTAQLITLEELIAGEGSGGERSLPGSVSASDAMKRGEEALRRKDIKSAISQYKYAIDYEQVTSSTSSFGSDSSFMNGRKKLVEALKEIANDLKNGDPLVQEALPLFHESFYFHSNKFTEMIEQYKSLETIIRKSGKDPDNFKDRHFKQSTKEIILVPVWSCSGALGMRTMRTCTQNCAA
jgi:hypothetical protein